MRREAVVDLLASQQRPLHINEIATRLEVPAGAYVALQRLLDDLTFDGSVLPLSGQRFRLAKDQLERHGTEHTGVLNLNPRGFGFVVVAGLPDDVYVPPESLGGAMHGDKVLVREVTRSRRGVEGEITKVLDRRSPRVAGTLRRRGKSAWLEPDDARVRGPIVLSRSGRERPQTPASDDALPKATDGAALGNDGDAAVVTITRFPVLRDENPEGELLAVLGPAGDPQVEVAKVLVREGIDEAHPPEAVAEAQAYGAAVAPEALVGREDLTHLPLPTIDPEDARDHDDAVWVTRAADGSYRAWIAIADVSHYVRPGTALDAAALGRANSIYLPDRAIPMLPRALSSHLCSLLPSEVRLCLCAEIDLDATGTVTGSRLLEGFMRSAAKLTYQGVARALGFTAEPARSPEAEALCDDLAVMWDLSRLLRGRRMRRGALDFDLPEPKIELSETGAPVGVEKRAKDPGVAKAYHLIEELMLLANETVARTLVERDVPAIFRNHGAPDQAKLERFATMCQELDLPFEVEDALDPKALSVFLKKVNAHPRKQVLHMLLLRAMKQAAYDVANIGHFGLASPAYLHFTSPIRRYPDLVVHRSVRALLRHEPVDRSEAAVERLRTAASIASDRERKGMDVEREVVDLYRALYMRAHLGEVVDGTVTGLVGTGVFVNVDSPFVDVLVRMESLGPDEYAIDEAGLRVIGTRSGDRIAIGDRMRVVIEDVSIVRRTVYGRRLVERSADGGGDGALGEKKKARKVKRSGRAGPAPGAGGKAKGKGKGPGKKKAKGGGR